MVTAKTSATVVCTTCFAGATVSPNDRVCKVIPFKRLLQTAVTSVDLVHISSIDYVEVRFLFVQCLHYLIYWRSIGKSV